MNKLVQMMETAIPEAMPKVGVRRTAGWNWRGFYINPDFFLGGRYDRPLTITFENNQGNSPSYHPSLDLEKTHFFALTGDEQFQSIIDFLRQARAGSPAASNAPDTPAV